MTEKSDKRIKYLNKSADLICRAAYRLCRLSLSHSGDKCPDAKELKELCAAVKEAMGIASGLEKNVGGESIRVIMEQSAEGFAK